LDLSKGKNGFDIDKPFSLGGLKINQRIDLTDKSVLKAWAIKGVLAKKQTAKDNAKISLLAAFELRQE